MSSSCCVTTKTVAAVCTSQRLSGLSHTVVHVAIGRSVNGIYVAVTVKLRRLLPVRWRGSDVADDRMRFDA